MKIIRTAGATITTVSLLTAAACSTSTEDETPAPIVETVTQSQDSPTTTATTTATVPAGGNGAGGADPADPADPTATDIPDTSELPPDPVGKEVTIAGTPATVCIYCDGWGTNIWAADANTSCDFVSAVHGELIAMAWIPPGTISART